MHRGRLECRLLGGFELRLDGHPLAVGQPKQRALLALLALRWDRPVFGDEIIDAIWDDAPPRGARNQVHVYVRGIRRMLAAAGVRPGIVVTSARGYRLDVPLGVVDLGVFHHLMANARQLIRAERQSDAAEVTRSALALWQGRPLGGIDGRYFERAATALEEQHLVALEQHMRLQMTLGRYAELAVTLRVALEAHPFHEELRYGLMYALYHCGRMIEALEVYREGRTRTVHEFGIEPGHRLQRLERRIVRNEPVPRSIEA
jgi:DNA-binding SARP family transcriptional activator